MSGAIEEPIHPRARRAGLALAGLAIVLNLGFAALLIDDLLHAYANPEDYPFGAENAGWAYRSFDTYLVSGLATLTPLVAGVAALLLARSWMLKLALGYAPIPLLLLIANMTA